MAAFLTSPFEFGLNNKAAAFPPPQHNARLHRLPAAKGGLPWEGGERGPGACRAWPCRPLRHGVNVRTIMNSSKHPPCHSQMPISAIGAQTSPPASPFFRPAASVSPLPLPPPLVLPHNSRSLPPSLVLVAAKSHSPWGRLN